MPLKYFICPDNEQIDIAVCLAVNGCRMGERCASLPYLRKISDEREYSGVTPSMAGSGPRMIYLKAAFGYAIRPGDRVWSVIGIGSHDELSHYQYTDNVLSEEKLSDEQTKGIADLLEDGENGYILTDYKIWGSYKVTKALGITTVETLMFGDNGNPILIQSGKNKGKQKTEKNFVTDPNAVDLFNEEMQLNRYRILFEKHGFPISQIHLQVMPRDGGTYIAKSRGIVENIYLIPIKILADEIVLDFYKLLQSEVDEAFKTGYIRKCNKRESWDYRRCDGYCEVSEQCKKMDLKEVA